MAEAPRFSIFIPVRNGAAWIEGAIESVLAQTYTHWELIIGDNVSDDGLEAVLDRYAGDPRIRCHRWATPSEWPHTSCLCSRMRR